MEALEDWGIGGFEDSVLEDWEIGGLEDWGICGLEDWPNGSDEKPMKVQRKSMVSPWKVSN